MKKILLFLTLLALISVQVVFAQDRTVTGTVTSADDGETIPGVSVVVKGTTQGTFTDVDGKYSIKVEASDAILLFSYIGMETQELAVVSTTLNVELKTSSIGVNEVVVTAMGISRDKKSLGYSSQKVTSEELTKASPINAVTSLSGKVAGLQVQGQNFAGSQNILIRGASSFSGNNQPLFVVDGIPVSNEGFNTSSAQTGGGGYDYGSMISDLNPNDIANVDVLKGSAASALYGSRGQNGVIMITTKKGVVGVDRTSVEINSSVSFDKVSVLPELQTSYGGGYGDFKTVDIQGEQYEVVLYSMDESWGPKYDAGREVIHWWGMYDYEQGITAEPVTAPWITPENDFDSYYETGVSFQNSVSVQNSSKNSTLRIGYTNLNMTGIVPNSEQDKHTLNLNGMIKLFDGLIEAKSNVTYVDTYTKGRPQFGYGDASVSQKMYQWGQRSIDMEKMKDYINPDGTQRTWNRRGTFDPTPNYSDNFYWTAYKNWQDDDRKRIYGNLGLKANITSYLTAEGNIFVDTYTFNVRERMDEGSQAQSSYSEVNRQSTESNIEGRINYNQTFIDVINVNAMFGGNIRNNEYTRLNGVTNGGIVVPSLWNLNNSVSQSIVDDYMDEKLVKSIFGMASIGYGDFAFLDATYRQDYDSSLPNNSNSYGYASVSGSLILSELLEMDEINNLKIRLNYGETGNGTDPYNVLNTYEVETPFNGTPVMRNSAKLLNQNLVPEKTNEFELGLEASIFNDRLGVDFSYYNKNTENQIVSMEVSGSTGYTSRVVNAGCIENKGVELLVYGTPVKVAGFKWDISVNFAKNNNKVLDLPDGLDKIQLASAPFSGAILNAVEGATFQELYAYNYVFDQNGEKVIDEESGFYARGDLESVGSALPDYIGGVRNSFSYKGFDLAALIDFSQGGKYYSLTYMWGMYSGMQENTATPTSNGNTIREDGIVVDGVIATEYDGDGNVTASKANDINIAATDYGSYFYHGMGTPSATSIFDASYVKLREVTLTYTIPQFVDFLKSAQVGVYGRNLAVWGLGYDGIDPETCVGGNGNVQGMEGGIVPATRSFGFSLKLGF